MIVTENTEKLWNTEYIKVMSANFTLYFAFYILSPLLPIYLSEQFGASKDTIGIVLSGYTVAALIIRPFSGYVVDTFDRKRILMSCIFLFFLFFIGYIAAGTLLMFAIFRTLHGAPFGAFTVANSTAAIDVLPSSQRNEGLGYYGLSNNLSMAVAPSIGIYIHKISNGFSLIFWIALIVAGIGVIILSTLRLPKRESISGKKKMSLDRFFLTRAWLMAINIAMFGFGFGTLSNFLAIYSKQELGITGGTGTYFMLLSMGLFLSRIQGGKALHKGLITHNASEGMLISLVGYFLFVAWINPVGYYLSAILIGLGNGHLYPAFLNMFIKVARHDERGTANSSILTGWDCGFGLGILVGGIAAEFWGYLAAFWIVFGVNISGVLLYFIKTKQFYLTRRLED